MNDALIFITSFSASFIFFRGIIYFLSKPYRQMAEYIRQGPKIHHLHVGFMIMFVGILALLVSGKNAYSISLLGLGCGMVTDEFIPSLYIPEQEPLVNSLYRKYFVQTVALNVVLILLVLFLAKLSNLF